MARDVRDIVFRFVGETRDLQRATSQAERGLGGVGGAMKKVAGLAAGAFAVSSIVDYGREALNLATAAEEVDSKFQAVFGSAKELEDSLRTWGDMAGVTEADAKNLAATFGNLAMAQGIAAGQAEELALDVATLAGDLASFNDADPAQVFEDINKGMLTTEREGLKKYGIAVAETEVKQRALNIATADGRTEVTQADRAMASYEIITRMAGKAVGDLERTQDSAASRTRQAKASMEELQTEVGTHLVGAYQDLLEILSDVEPLLRGMVDQFGLVAGAVTTVTDAVNGLTSAIPGTTEGFEVLGMSLQETFNWLNPVTAALQFQARAADEADRASRRSGGGIRRAGEDAAAATPEIEAAGEAFAGTAEEALNMYLATKEGGEAAARVEAFTARTTAALGDVITAFRNAEEAARRFGSLDFTAFGVGDDRPSERGTQDNSYTQRNGTPPTAR